jgi:hypothetical protein
MRNKEVTINQILNIAMEMDQAELLIWINYQLIMVTEEEDFKQINQLRHFRPTKIQFNQSPSTSSFLV